MKTYFIPVFACLILLRTVPCFSQNTFPSSGNVGIGTSSPTSKLHVVGNADIGDDIDPTSYGLLQVVRPPFPSDNKFYLSFIRNGYIGLGMGYGANSSVFSIWHANDNQGTPVLSFTPDQNVGIGTTNPQAKLAVNGNIFSKKVKVTQSGWPDYVFQTTYRLRPLSEVEQYIQLHHHLPEVPSATDVEREGLDVGDNQATLLKKIEELTLYIINLNKEVEALKKELKQGQYVN